MAKLVHFFFDVDLRCNHRGLLEILKKKKIKITEDDFIVFMNHKRTMVKMLCKGKEALLHWRNENRILDPGVVRHLPKFCDGTSMDVDAAVESHLMEIMSRRPGTKKFKKN